MLKYLARRALYMVIMMALVSVFAFVLINLPPGNYLDRLVEELEASGELVDQAELADLTRRYGLDQPLHGVMTADPKTVGLDDSILDVLYWMSQGGYRRLPVVDAAAAPVGIVGVKAVTHFLVQHFPAAVYNQAAYTHLMASRREGA